MKCLFIGGPKAGCYIDVEVTRSRIDFPVIDRAPSTQFPGGAEPANSTFKSVSYVRDRATDKAGNRHGLFVFDGDEDPLITLMQFYAENAQAAKAISVTYDFLEALELMAIDYHRKGGLGFDLLASTKMFAAINKAKGLAK